MAYPYAAKRYIPGLGKDVLVQPNEISFNIPYQAHSVATDVPTLVADFNALLDKLTAAGIMLPSGTTVPNQDLGGL